MKKTILFDLDGTLTDSGEGIINCVIFALEQLGVPVPSREALRVFVGPPLEESFLRHGVPPEQVQEAVELFRSRYAPIGKFENFPYPGIFELLETLKADGDILCVATSKPEGLAREVLDHFGLTKYFHRICGASLDSSRSTKDAVIAYLLEQHKDSSKMVMVGDTKYDVLGAAAHGIQTIGVSWGYGEVEQMQRAGAIAIAHTMSELLMLLRSI